MNVPSDAFYDKLSTHRDNNHPFDYSYMNMRDELNSTWFPYNSQIARALLRDKHVMFIGDSLVRGMYKDMLALLQTGNLSQIHDLRVSNEDSIHGDKHIDFIELAANRVFRQAREFQSNQHLIQYFFTNRAMREDLDKTCLLIEATDERPDVVVINSAIWDVSRYPTRMTGKWTSEHMDDLEEEINVADDYFNRIAMFCRRMRVLLPPSSTMVWVLMPPSATSENNNKTGFLANNQLDFYEIRGRLLEANVRAAQIVREAGFDVLDLSFHFRLSNYQAFRVKDGVHFNVVGTRYMNQLLLGHLATVWEIEIRKKWPPRILEKTQEKTVLFTTALEFLQDMNTLKHRNEETHQLVRRAVFEDYKLPNSQCEMSCLHQILRFLLAFFRFEEASKSKARGISNAFSAMPNELSRYSQEDLQRISEMIKQCSALKNTQMGILMKTTNKRVHERMVSQRVSPDAPPGIRIRMDDEEEGPIDGDDEIDFEADDMNIVVSSDESVATLSPPRSRHGYSSDGYSNSSPGPSQNKRFRYHQ
ncbi:unnamed protein product [Caenorhabditis nigoni]